MKNPISITKCYLCDKRLDLYSDNLLYNKECKYCNKYRLFVQSDSYVSNQLEIIDFKLKDNVWATLFATVFDGKVISPKFTLDFSNNKGFCFTDLNIEFNNIDWKNKEKLLNQLNHKLSLLAFL